MSLESNLKTFYIGTVGLLTGSMLGTWGGGIEQLRVDKSALISAIIEKHDDPKTPRDIVGSLGIDEVVNPAARIIYVLENPSIQGIYIDRELLITALAADRTDSRNVEAPTPAEEISDAQ